MTARLGTFFKAARLAKGLTLKGLALLTGHANARKGAGRIARFEQGGSINDELLARLADALGIDYATIERLTTQDRPEASYALQRPDGRYLTPHYLQWSVTLTEAQRCDQDEARAIQGWLKGIGIEVTLIDLSTAQADAGNFAE